jgi:hypothetical protein
VRRLALVAVLLGLTAGPALADQDPIDQMELWFGATHVTAQSGNGGLSVGIAPRGEITVLSWPSPTFYDQLEYETSNAEDARELPFFGASADQGVFSGLWLEIDGQEPRLLWLRDEEFVVQQRYATEGSAAVEMLHVHEGLGLSVLETTFVDVDSDTAYRRTLVKRHPDSPVESVRYVLYENLAPAADKPADLSFDSPNNPELLDDEHDFAAFWDPSVDAVVHFAPPAAQKDTELLTGLLSGGLWGLGDTWQSLGLPLVDELLAGFYGAVFVGVAGATAPDAFQIGWQDDEPCELPAAWSWLPVSAFEDLADGELEGSPVAGCHVDAALAWDVEFGLPGSDAEAVFDTVLVGASSADGVAEAVAAARVEGFDAAFAATEAAWQERGAAWTLPEGLDAEVGHFSRRALTALIQGADAEATAIVASLAVQPSYHHDWPRDSVFFDLALDLAGEFDLVSRHKLFLAGVQNRETVWGGTDDNPIMKSPPGAWFMNYYADGQPSTTFMNTFEIDQVGLMLWGYWAHGAFAPNDNVRRDVIAAAWPSIERGADLLAACVDDDHPALADAEVEAGVYGWWPVYEALLAGQAPDADARFAAASAGDWEALRPCAANEDDNPVSSVSVYSTHVTRMGLLGAVRAAELLCLDDDPKVAYWRERADELAAVAFALYYDEAAQEWEGRTDWLLWPEPLRIVPGYDALFSDAADAGDRRIEVEAFEREALDALAAADHAQVDDATNLRTEGAAYVNKKTLSLARWWTGDRAPEGDQRAENAEHVRQLAVDLPIPGTRHVGEVWISIDDDGDGVFDRADQRVSTPHLWAATLTYLSAMAVDRPELFEALESDEVSPLCTTGEEPIAYRDVKDCADCEDSLVGGDPTGVAALLFGLALVLRRRRTGTGPSEPLS